MIRKDIAKLAYATLTAASTAGVGMASPTAGAIVAGLNPLVLAVGDYGINRMMTVAAAASNLTGQQIAERLADSPEGVRLMIAATEAARRAVIEEKLQALGRCLAVAASSDGIVDLEVLLVDVIDSLESSHLRVLRVMQTLRHWDLPEDQGGPRDTEWWAVLDFEAVDPNLTQQIAEMLIGKMLGQGVVGYGVPTADSLNKGGEYRITELGRRVLERVDGATPSPA